MAEANGTVRSYLPLILTVGLSVAPMLVVGGRLLNRVEQLETALKERAAGLQQHMDNLADAANARWLARDRQAEAGDQRLRALAEMVIAQSRDDVAMSSNVSRQDETIRQMLGRLERLIDRLNEVERELRPYQLPQQRDRQ